MEGDEVLSKEGTAAKAVVADSQDRISIVVVGTAYFTL